MKPIKFNDTSDYQYLEVLGTEGVFTPLRIQPDTLPEGLHKYSLREGDASFIAEVAKDVMVNHTGDFITRTPLDLGPEGARQLGEDDWGFTDKPFDFEGFFGVKRSLDCQIADANTKRDAQAGDPKSKGQMKSNPLAHEGQ